MNRHIRTLVLLALVLLSGCASRGPVRESAPELTRDEKVVSRLIAGQRERVAQRRALRARARVSLSGAVGESFAKQVVLLERPARLRLEVVGLLGQRLAILATDGETYDLFRRPERGISSGTIHPGILWEVAGVPLTPDLAVELLLGVPPVPEEDAVEEATLARTEDGVRIRTRDRASGYQTLEFDSRGELRAATWESAGGESLLEVRYDDFREVGEERFAHEIKIVFPRERARAALSYREVELNPELPDALFQLRDADTGDAG